MNCKCRHHGRGLGELHKRTRMICVPMPGTESEGIPGGYGPADPSADAADTLAMAQGFDARAMPAGYTASMPFQPDTTQGWLQASMTPPSPTDAVGAGSQWGRGGLPMNWWLKYGWPAPGVAGPTVASTLPAVIPTAIEGVTLPGSFGSSQNTPVLIGKTIGTTGAAALTYTSKKVAAAAGGGK